MRRSSCRIRNCSFSTSPPTTSTFPPWSGSTPSCEGRGRRCSSSRTTANSSTARSIACSPSSPRGCAVMPATTSATSSCARRRRSASRRRRRSNRAGGRRCRLSSSASAPRRRRRVRCRAASSCWRRKRSCRSARSAPPSASAFPRRRAAGARSPGSRTCPSRTARNRSIAICPHRCCGAIASRSSASTAPERPRSSSCSRGRLLRTPGRSFSDTTWCRGTSPSTTPSGSTPRARCFRRSTGSCLPSRRAGCAACSAPSSSPATTSTNASGCCPAGNVRASRWRGSWSFPRTSC